MAASADREARIQEIGRQLFDSLAAEGPLRSTSSLLSGRALQRRLFTRAVEDPHFKTQLFRFIDVYPSLRDSGDLVRHLRAYLDDRGEVPPPLDRLLASGAGRRLPSWAVARLTDRAMQRMAKGLIAGRDAAEALPTLRRLRRQHAGFSLDILGEACLSEAEAAAYLLRYQEALDSLPARAATWPADSQVDSSPAGDVPRVDVSLKISSVYSQLDPLDFDASRRAVVARLKPLFLKGRRAGASFCIDVERHASLDLAYAVFADLVLDDGLRDYPHLGIVLQSYLRDSEEHFEMLLDLARRRETPITVRLVKGAYWDQEVVAAGQEHWRVPVFLTKAETDARFEKLAGRLMENWQWTRPALATHNIRSMAAGLAAAQEAGLAPGAVEIQMLHGLAEPVRRAAVARGYRVREYVPVGEMIPGMAYLVRRLLETTSNQSFLRLAFAQLQDPSGLLKPPAVGSEPAVAESGAERAAEPAPFHNEPHADFSKAEAREEMEKALGLMRGSLGRDYHLLIGGESIATSQTTFSLNPARPDQVVGRVASASREHAGKAIEAARAAFPAWRDTSPRKRAGTLFKAAALMRSRRFELAALEVLEAGKPWREADGDVTEAIDFLEYYGREMLRLHRARDLSDVPGEIDLYFYEPRGVAAVIAPWNFPLAIPTGMVSAALVAGNTVIFKPANPTPVIGYAMVRIFHEAGVPEAALNFLPGPGSEVGDYLSADPRVDLIAFTGSLDVGLSIMQKAAVVAAGQRNVKKVVTEMGGKNAIIIDTDADLDAAVQGVVVSAFHYAGQKCSACSRVIVVEEVYEQFLRRLTAAVASLKLGDPARPGTRLGPVITAEARERILAYIEKGKGEARLAYPPAGHGPLPEPVTVEAPALAVEPAAAEPAPTEPAAAEAAPSEPTTVEPAAIESPEAEPVKATGRATGGEEHQAAAGEAAAEAAPQAGAAAESMAPSTATTSVESPPVAASATSEGPTAEEPAGASPAGAEPAVPPPVAAESPTLAPASAEPAASTQAAPEEAEQPGYFLLPHIFADVRPDSVIAQEEIFGPVLTVLKAQKFADALEMALGVRYGLTGGVYSRNPAHIRRAYNEFRVGNLYINRPITGAMVGRQPFGGSRMSGVGSKAGGPDYLLQFMEPRTITENTMRRGFVPETEE